MLIDEQILTELNMPVSFCGTEEPKLICDLLVILLFI